MAVPSGYYDREHVAWMPEADGRVVQIVAITDGLAQLDTTGDGADTTLRRITDASARSFRQPPHSGRHTLACPFATLRRGTTTGLLPPWNAIWPFGQGPSYDNAPDQPCRGGRLHHRM
ncbi:MAG: hypothetical protein R2911_28445 [Caldilineaceae bacterium]